MTAKTSLFLLLAASVLLPSSPAAAAPLVTFGPPTSFDYPGTGVTQANAVNDRAAIAGYFFSNGQKGFIRIRSHFSRPISDPNDRFNGTELSGINNAGTECGFYLGTDQSYHSFLLSGSTFTEVDIGITDLIAGGINDAGNLSGSTLEPYGGFVFIDGIASSFTVPGAQYMEAHGMNNANQCTGSYFDGLTSSGFRRDADGTLEFPIVAPGYQATYLYGINDAGWMVGSVLDDSGEHAIFFGPGNVPVAYDYPGATFTRFTGVNNRGLICGFYEDSAGTHSFTIRVSTGAEK